MRISNRCTEGGRYFETGIGLNNREGRPKKCERSVLERRKMRGVWVSNEKRRERL